MLPSRAAVAAAVLLLLASPSAAAGSNETKLKKPRMAILDFPAASGAWGCGGWASSEGRMANVLRDLFTTAIMERADGKVRLVERERLAAIRSELSFQQSGEVDGATAQKLGKLLGVRYMLTGKMTRFACKKSGFSSGWGVGALVGKATKSGLAGSVAGSVKTDKVRFTGRLDVRLIDTQSGEVLGTFKDEEDTSDLSVEIAGGGTDVAYDDELANKVFEPVVERLSPKILKKISAVHEESLAEDSADDVEAEVARDSPARGAKGSAAKLAAAREEEDEEAEAPSKRGAAKAGKGGAAPVPAVYGNEFDFVPGEKLIFFDDFSDTDAGEYPMKWRHSGGDGTEIVETGGRHWLRIQDGKRGSSYDLVRAKLTDLPKKFTIEFDAMLGAGWVHVLCGHSCELAVLSATDAKTGSGTTGKLPSRLAGEARVAISVSDTYEKIYVNGRRVVMDPDGVKRPIKEFGIRLGYGQDGVPLMVTNVRLAEGGKDHHKEWVNLSRIVTHGITFDSGSHVPRPESGPTLRSILKLLQDDPSLRFEIEGHTDDQGGASVNGPLSERRASAVKAWLVAQGVDDGRLTAKGLGASKPLQPNDTPEGRAENRRVELVKTSTRT